MQQFKPIRGNNGNILKAVELIAKFDCVLFEHINNIKKDEDYVSACRMTHYLGEYFYNEIIALLADSTKK